MANFYYSVGTAESNFDLRVSSLGESGNLITIPRKSIVGPRSYRKVGMLKRRRKRTDDSGKRDDISARIKKILVSSRELKLDFPKGEEITDIYGCLIGRIYYSEEEELPDDIFVGNDRYIGGVSFDFTEKKRGYSLPQRYVVRTTALITEEGMKNIREYIEENTQKGLVLSSSSEETVDIMVQNMHVHIKPKGKVNMHFLYNGLDGLLCDVDGLSGEQKEILEYFTRNTHTNRWVKNTNMNFNAFMGEAFRAMGEVIKLLCNYETKSS